ncbi:MAG: LuxR C-terminal-related transcriptional regulator [Gaiellales bacterium]
MIEACHEVYELRRAREWTDALTRWCSRQPDLVSFTGRCLLHRAEIMQFRGAWSDALAEARRAAERLLRDANRSAAAQALYYQGEVHRLQGRFAEAESSYRQASLDGWEPQPGLALLRLAQGETGAAAAAIRRALAEAAGPVPRLRLLPAYVEIMLAAGDIPAARRACTELDEFGDAQTSGMLAALAAHARGAVELADGDAWAALVTLRHARELWRELDVPYEAARVRALVGLACRSVGDSDAAAMELEAAREALRDLGAAPGLRRLEELSQRPGPRSAGGLTPRESEVLVLVTAGKTNRDIAAELVISEKTVARHVSNIFSKLGVSSRAAATAFAYEHRLV